jgi:hypothetical protein
VKKQASVSNADPEPLLIRCWIENKTLPKINPYKTEQERLEIQSLLQNASEYFYSLSLSRLRWGSAATKFVRNCLLIKMYSNYRKTKLQSGSRELHYLKACPIENSGRL